MNRRSVIFDVVLAVTAAGLGVLVASRIDRGLSNATTGLVFHVAAGMALALALRMLVRLLRRPAYLREVTLLAGTIAVTVAAVDAVLRYQVRTRLTYGESNGSPLYRSVYRYDNPSWYHTYGRNRRMREVRTEFTHERTTNALGLTERDVPLEKPADEYRVLALGDSYTEGVGAGYDESWVRVFERHTPRLADGRTVRAINAGISGSDLFLQYVLLRDKLAAFRPDLVIVALNNSDVADTMTRGGMSRFRPDGSIRGDRGPSWDWLYGISFLTRHVVHDLLDRTWLLLSMDEHTAAQAVARAELREAIDRIREVVTGIGARFVLVLNPHQSEVQTGAYEAGFKPLADALLASGDAAVIDVLAGFMAGGIVTKDTSGSYYWTLDYHHNARGYEAMGTVIANEVRARHLLPDEAPPGHGRDADTDSGAPTRRQAAGSLP